MARGFGLLEEALNCLFSRLLTPSGNAHFEYFLSFFCRRFRYYFQYG